MLNNADQVEQLLQTNGLGAKAQVGYDLTLKEVKKVQGGLVSTVSTIVNPYKEVSTFTMEDNQEYFILSPGTYSITFEQGIQLPSNKTAFIVHRSSILRCGSVITSGIYDPGFQVEEMGAMLIVTEQITIQKGARVAQVYVFENTETEKYNGQWQGEKDVK